MRRLSISIRRIAVATGICTSAILTNTAFAQQDAIIAEQSLLKEETRAVAEAADTIGAPKKNTFQRLRESPFGLSLELASRYIYRGCEYGDAPVGFATISYATHGFGAWATGAYAVNGSHSEVDLGITYQYKWLFVGLSDYYYPTPAGEKDHFFEMNNHKTGHWGELYATVTPFKFPLWLTVSCYLYGADKKPDGKQAYSSYAELGYTYNFKGDNAISLAVGACLNKSYYTNYESGFNVVNINLKYSTAFRFGSFKLPVAGNIIYNPYTNKPFITLSLFFGI